MSITAFMSVMSASRFSVFMRQRTGPKTTARLPDVCPKQITNTTQDERRRWKESERLNENKVITNHFVGACFFLNRMEQHAKWGQYVEINRRNSGKNFVGSCNRGFFAQCWRGENIEWKVWEVKHQSWIHSEALTEEVAHCVVASKQSLDTVQTSAMALVVLSKNLSEEQWRHEHLHLARNRHPLRYRFWISIRWCALGGLLSWRDLPHSVLVCVSIPESFESKLEQRVQHGLLYASRREEEGQSIWARRCVTDLMKHSVSYECALLQRLSHVLYVHSMGSRHRWRNW